MYDISKLLLKLMLSSSIMQLVNYTDVLVCYIHTYIHICIHTHFYSAKNRENESEALFMHMHVHHATS